MRSRYDSVIKFRRDEVTAKETIAKQDAEIDSLRAQIEAYESGLLNLRRYLESDKFAIDPTVQTADVLRSLETVRSAVVDEAFVPRGLASAIKPNRYGRLIEDFAKGVRYA